MDLFQENVEDRNYIDNLSKLEVNVEGFSGPLDLLCCLVESREIELSKVRLGELVRVYGAFLSGSGKAPINVIADFITATAGLLLKKVMTLFPDQDVIEEDSPEEKSMSEEEILLLLERYRPYRKARQVMEAMKLRQERLYERDIPHEEYPLYDLGDLYNLAAIWWRTIYSKEVRISQKNTVLSMLPEGIPMAVPEEVQVETRIKEIAVCLEGKGELRLKELVHPSFSIPFFVVTILALLEMARLKRIFIRQEEMFGDVIISSNPFSVRPGEIS
ncbi:MAG: segregation/condensation protein A [Synergistales bacterium]|nr:segregation/condensation protein A [Synergistales bacterium]